MQVFAMLFAAAFLVLPVVALLLALNALSRVKTRAPGSIGGQLEELSATVKALENQVRRLTKRIAAIEGEGAPAARVEAPAEPPVEVAVLAPTEAPAAAPTPPPPVPEPPEPPPAPTISRPLPPTRTLEERIGARWATWVGVIVLVFAVGFFIREIFARNLIGYPARVAIGLGIGIAMVAGGLVLWHRRSLPYLSVGVSGGGLAILYLSLFAGYNLYHLFAAPTAFVAMVAVTLGGSVLAALSGQLPLAVLAVLGGLLTPILAHGEQTDERVLLGYLIVLDLLVLAVSRWRSWPALNRLAWVGSAVLLIPTLTRTPDAEHPATRLLLLTLLFAVFLAIPLLRAWIDRFASEPLDLILVLANGAMYFAAVYTTLETWQPSFEGPWAFGLAAAYLAVGIFHQDRVPEDDGTASVHYGAAAVMVALAFPLMLDGPWVTLAWAAQAVVLVFVAPKTPKRDVALTIAVVLFAATIARAAYLDRYWYPSSTRIFNVTFAVGLVVVAALAIAGQLAGRLGETGSRLRSTFWVGAAILMAALAWHEPTGVWPGVWLTIELVALALLARAQGDDAFRLGVILLVTLGVIRLFMWDASKAAAAAGSLVNPWLLARVGNAVAVAYSGATLRHEEESESSKALGRSLLGLAWVELLVGLSLGWFLHMDHRIHAAAELANALRWKMQLGLSVLWAAYAGVSLAFGFLWMEARLRYAALGLLGVTVVKVFLIDLSEVQAIWRILSFLMLGLVLLAVSVVYQRRLK